MLAITSETFSPDVASYFLPESEDIAVFSIAPSDLRRALGTSAVPTTILTDAKRRTVLYRVGLVQAAELDQMRETVAELATTGG